MSEKPFWEGKTLMEIQNLDKRVKVTMENGDVFIGKLVRRSRDTDGICSLSMQLDAHRTYLHVFSAESSDTQPVIPSYVDTVELLDDPEYERIDNIEDVHTGDIFVAKSGNRYDIRCVDPRRGRPVFEVSIEGEVREWIGSKSFAYALRLELRLPDEPGLWLDKDDNTWMFKGGSIQCIRIGTGKWNFDRSWISADSALAWLAAPFRPVKAVEA